nr:MAG TPA_asm: hypothetical protein [Caudoviricetes sp.]
MVTTNANADTIISQTRMELYASMQTSSLNS